MKILTHVSLRFISTNEKVPGDVCRQAEKIVEEDIREHLQIRIMISIQ